MKTKTKMNEKDRGAKMIVERIGLFLEKHYVTIACFMFLTIMTSNVVFASTASADSLWNEAVNVMKTWVSRLGGGVMFVGVIMLGMGWKSDDAEQKSRGISTIVAGGIVLGGVAIASNFLA